MAAQPFRIVDLAAGGGGFPTLPSNWKTKKSKPTLPSQTPGDFTFADLLRFVDDINPLGD